jgi:hypothetical protein
VVTKAFIEDKHLQTQQTTKTGSRKPKEFTMLQGNHSKETNSTYTPANKNLSKISYRNFLREKRFKERKIKYSFLPSGFLPNYPSYIKNHT